MYCIDCGTKNPKESKFCRECGRKMLSMEDVVRLKPIDSSQPQPHNIEPVEPSHESEEVRRLLDMAFWHNEAGHVNASMIACEAALALDPNSTSALSLLGCLYEKQGNPSKAIEAFERIIQLNPESVADFEKLQHLIRGIKDKAVAPSLIHQLTPPVLLQTARKYPSFPIIAAAVVVLLLSCFGTDAILRAISARSANKAALSAQLSSPTLPSTPSPAASSPAPVSPAANQLAPGTIGASSPQAATGDPFAGSSSASGDQSSGAQSASAPSSRHSSSTGASSNSIPSVGNIKPLTVPASSVPNHIVAVNAAPPQNMHTIDVTPLSASDSGQENQDNGGSDSAPAPASHIIITVHGDNQSSGAAGATPLPSDNQLHSISLQDNAGASLQQKGLNLQEAGNYKAALAAYESAIGAYQKDLNSGRNADEAKSGIDACKVAIEICKQSQ
jgi:tetratricopeptide (TPR) repeat protein